MRGNNPQGRSMVINGTWNATGSDLALDTAIPNKPLWRSFDLIDTRAKNEEWRA
jgi:hypothetical protein